MEFEVSFRIEIDDNNARFTAKDQEEAEEKAEELLSRLADKINLDDIATDPGALDLDEVEFGSRQAFVYIVEANEE